MTEWRLVTADSPRADHNAVRRFDTWLSREEGLGIFPFNWRPETAARHPDWEGWLLGTKPHGGAIFTRGGIGADWHLDRVWISPRFRRQGELAAVWETWLERYGSISATPSPALREFLRARGATALASPRTDSIWIARPSRDNDARREGRASSPT